MKPEGTIFIHKYVLVLLFVVFLMMFSIIVGLYVSRPGAWYGCNLTKENL